MQYRVIEVVFDPQTRETTRKQVGKSLSKGSANSTAARLNEKAGEIDKVIKSYLVEPIG
jgi:hypothetical protein